jgi:SAM-dependent methyltransferase
MHYQRISSEHYWKHQFTIYGRVKDTFGEDFLQSIQITGKVADVGCSQGITTIEMANLFPNSDIFGFDINREILDMARNSQGYHTKKMITNGEINSEKVNSINSRLLFFVEDGYDLNWPDKFQGMFYMNNLMSQLINHGEIPNLEGVLKGIDYHLETDGFLFFSGIEHHVTYKKDNNGKYEMIRRDDCRDRKCDKFTIAQMTKLLENIGETRE